jgi:hypothetical protein
LGSATLTSGFPLVSATLTSGFPPKVDSIRYHIIYGILPS